VTGLWRIARGCDLPAVTAQASFFLMLSIFPILVTIGALMPYLRISPETVTPWLGNVFPQPILEIVESEITDLLTNTNRGILSLGILGILWSSAAVMRTFQAAFDRAYSLKCSNCMVSAAVLPVLTIFIVIVFALAFVAAAGLGESLVSRIVTDTARAEKVVQTLHQMGNILALTVPVLLFSAIYKLIPNVHLAWRETAWGSLFAAAGFLLVNRLFAFYIGLMLRPNQSFGARGAMAAYKFIASLFMLGLWMRLICYVIMLGAVINAWVHKRKHRLAVQKVTKADRLLQTLVERIREGRSRRDET